MLPRQAPKTAGSCPPAACWRLDKCAQPGTPSQVSAMLALMDCRARGYGKVQCRTRHLQETGGTHPQQGQAGVGGGRGFLLAQFAGCLAAPQRGQHAAAAQHTNQSCQLHIVSGAAGIEPQLLAAGPPSRAAQHRHHAGRQQPQTPSLQRRWMTTQRAGQWLGSCT